MLVKGVFPGIPQVHSVLPLWQSRGEERGNEVNIWFSQPQEVQPPSLQASLFSFPQEAEESQEAAVCPKGAN